MSPLEFMQRLAALVPRPRLHLIRGIFEGQVFTFDICGQIFWDVILMHVSSVVLLFSS
jgi:hypothetical protein